MKIDFSLGEAVRKSRWPETDVTAEQPPHAMPIVVVIY